MGGRGASSHILTRIGMKLNMNFLGKALSATEALPLVNPNFNLGQEYQDNCQRCVWAFEMLRRGYAVEAAPSNSSGYTGTSSSIRDFWFSAKNAKQENYIRLDYLANTVSGQYAIVEKKMHEWGEGSRAILGNVWNGGGGHIWNVELSGGTVHYYDGQIGREVDVIRRNNLSRALDIFARIDNLDVPKDILNAVVVKNNKKKKGNKP